MKLKYLEGVVAIGLFLSGWIFSQALSLTQSVLKSIESIAVIGASVSAIIAAYVGIKAYYSWRKPELYGEIKGVSSLIETEVSELVEIIRECQKLIHWLESKDSEKIVESRGNIYDLYSKLLISRAKSVFKINRVIPVESDDGKALDTHLSLVLSILKTFVDEVSKIETGNVSPEDVEKIKNSSQKLLTAISEEVKCSEIIRRRLERI
ncbi:hypothetical protein [Shewanella chilikensis]|uniref:hypothetical protein n=1 Tax=Shewanella chilikensis TaxID=558541 RepID=UPI00399B7524